jgi:hypothetical protein
MPATYKEQEWAMCCRLHFARAVWGPVSVATGVSHCLPQGPIATVNGASRIPS